MGNRSQTTRYTRDQQVVRLLDITRRSEAFRVVRTSTGSARSLQGVAGSNPVSPTNKRARPVWAGSFIGFVSVGQDLGGAAFESRNSTTQRDVTCRIGTPAHQFRGKNSAGAWWLGIPAAVPVRESQG